MTTLFLSCLVMDVEQLDTWFSPQQRQKLAELLRKRIGLTRRRAELFLRLWIYLLVKQKRKQEPCLHPPLTQLEFPQGAISCTQREAAEIFYSDRESGSDRAAGMMLDKLAALNLIKKSFDGGTTNIEIQPLPDILSES